MRDSINLGSITLLIAVGLVTWIWRGWLKPQIKEVSGDESESQGGTPRANRDRETIANELVPDFNSDASSMVSDEYSGLFWTPYENMTNGESLARESNVVTQNSDPQDGSWRCDSQNRFRNVQAARPNSPQVCERITLLEMIRQQEPMIHDLSQEPFWPFDKLREGSKEGSDDCPDSDAFPPLSRQGNIYINNFPKDGELAREERTEGLSQFGETLPAYAHPNEALSVASPNMVVRFETIL